MLETSSSAIFTTLSSQNQMYPNPVFVEVFSADDHLRMGVSEDFRSVVHHHSSWGTGSSSLLSPWRVAPLDAAGAIPIGIPATRWPVVTPQRAPPLPAYACICCVSVTAATSDKFRTFLWKHSGSRCSVSP